MGPICSRSSFYLCFSFRRKADVSGLGSGGQHQDHEVDRTNWRHAVNLEKVKVVVIAEVGSVHDGSVGNALCLIDAAADCGVDAVKFQTHIPEAETLPDAPMPSYFKSESPAEKVWRAEELPSNCGPF